MCANSFLCSMQIYSQITKETGQDINFHQAGSIRLAASPITVKEFK